MKWFTAQANGDGTASVSIDKIIASDWSPDWVVDFFGEKSAREFIEAVDALGDLTEIHLALNTPGGDVFSGIRIANYLIAHKAQVHITVEAMAASIGSVILLAGDTRTMKLGSRVMTHSPKGGLNGWFSAADMREHADRIDEIENAIIEIYVARSGTGKTAEEFRDLLKQGDVYMDADTAIEWGFATDKNEQMQVAACLDQGVFEIQAKARAAEQKYQDAVDKYGAAADKIEALTNELAALKNPAAASAEDVIALCAKAGHESLAVGMVQAKLPKAAVEQQLAMAAGIQDMAKASGIEAAPLLAKLSDPLAMLGIAVHEAKALVDQDLDNHTGPRQGAKAQTPDHDQAYAQLNNPGG